MRMRRKLFTGVALGTLVLGAAPCFGLRKSRVSVPISSNCARRSASESRPSPTRSAFPTSRRQRSARPTPPTRKNTRNVRADRKELLSSELQAMGQVLTPEQRETAKGYVEDFKAAAASAEGPEMCPIRETVADRLHAAIEKINLTPEQRTKIREAYAPFAEKHRAQRAERLQLVQDELKSASEVLTPEQRTKVRSLIEARMVHSPVAQICIRANACAGRSVGNQLRSAYQDSRYPSQLH